ISNGIKFTPAGGLSPELEAFLAEVAKGNLPPIAPWKRWDGKVEAPAFGAEPPMDLGNPAPEGKEGWNTPVEGGTLIVQYNSAPKDINGIISNDAIVTYVNDLHRPVLAHQDPVRFRYGVPSKEDPERVFLAGHPGDIAERWVKEDTLVRADGSRRFGAVSEEGGSWVVKPLDPATAAGAPPRAEERIAKAAGDRVLRGTFVTVHLRPGVTWEDGAPFTARDVAFSMDCILNENVNSDNIKPVFEVVESCEALSDSVLRWVLRRQYFAADDSTVGGNLQIVPLHAYRAAFGKANPGAAFDPKSPEFARFFNTCTALNERPLSAGPYRVEAFEANRSVTLVRNEGYFGPRPRPDRILWKFISDEVAAIQALKAGEVDFVAHGPSAEQYSKVMQEPAFRERFVPSVWYTPSVSFIAFNRRSPCTALADARVRAALGMLLDRPGFRTAKHYGCSVLLSGDQFVSGPAYDPEVRPTAFDPEAAKELLDEAGWRDRDGDGVRDRDGKRLEFEFLITAENKPIEELTAMWLEQLGKAGVSCKVAKMEWAAFIGRFEDKKFDAITLAWASDPESDPHQLWHSKWADPTKPSSNATSFADPRADALIEAIQECLDPVVRQRYQRALHRILDADAAYTYLWCRAEIGAYDRRWRGVKLYPKRPGFDLTEWYMPKELQGKR
ncbi:MAG: hypothetical protein HUU06_07550, partial [Planctomycetaceae bacterium]|nr:hypothetical protein [Planctomycetaceae bacterium]